MPAALSRTRQQARCHRLPHPRRRLARDGRLRQSRSPAYVPVGYEAMISCAVSFLVSYTHEHRRRSACTSSRRTAEETSVAVLHGDPWLRTAGRRCTGHIRPPMCHHRLLATLRLRRWQIWRRSASCVPTAARGADGDVEALPLMLGLAEENGRCHRRDRQGPASSARETLNAPATPGLGAFNGFGLVVGGQSSCMGWPLVRRFTCTEGNIYRTDSPHHRTSGCRRGCRWRSRARRW